MSKDALDGGKETIPMSIPGPNIYINIFFNFEIFINFKVRNFANK